MATIEAYRTAKGEKRWRVRYRTPERRQTDKRGFRRKADAAAFAASVEVSKSMGAYVPASAGRVTVGARAGFSPGVMCGPRRCRRGSVSSWPAGRGRRQCRRRMGRCGRSCRMR